MKQNEKVYGVTPDYREYRILEKVNRLIRFCEIKLYTYLQQNN